MLILFVGLMKESVDEERWNVLTHGAGIVFALIAFPVLFAVTESDVPQSKWVGMAIYGVSFLLLYVASTSYHAARSGRLKRNLRKVDHISIYFMISGSYVPYMLEYIAFDRAITFLSIMYLLVFMGSVLKIWFTGKFEKASVILYIFLGWMIVFMARSFVNSASLSVITMVVLGGVAYMSGVYFYMRDQRRYYHAIWHVFVLLGSVFHFIGVFLI